MNEIILLLLAIVGIFSVACSVALIALGKMIDQYPIGDETSRERSLSSPAESTKLAVIVFWSLFIPGAWAVLQEGIITRIVGITLFFSICLFMFTALAFSFAVLSTMKSRKKEMGIPVIQTIPSPAVPGTVQMTQCVPDIVTTKRYKTPLSNFMISALLKKE
ncbi:MAG: hypothetical protein WC593_08085 [Methanoregula sp.]